uniref:Uncharacterized protein n=1 Tax=Anguilla anguilla TaxID=7936 RepID=A0A0E9TCC0_ANGAN
MTIGRDLTAFTNFHSVVNDGTSGWNTRVNDGA